MVTQSERRATRLFVVGLAASAALLLLFALLAREVMAGDTVAFDLSLRELVHAHGSPALTEVMRFFTRLGSTASLLLLGAAAFFALRMAGWKRESILFLVAVGGAFVLDMTLKYSFRRPRPSVSFFGTPIPHTPSFPSGHALYSVCFFGVLAALIAARAKRWWIRAAVWTAASAIAILIGMSRIYLGVHYPSDVAAGYAAALVWVSAIGYGERLLLRRRGSANRR